MFCNGELYGLCDKRKLTKFEIDVDKDGAPVITAKRRLVTQSINRTIHTGDYKDSFSYIFDLEGTLAMAMKNRWLPSIQQFFKVFKLVVIRTGKRKAHKWMEVTSLGDYALFLGTSFSKAVQVSVTNMRGGMERNRMYYTRHCWLGRNTAISSDKVFLKISNDGSDMTCYKEDDSKNSITDDNMERIMSVGYIVQGGLHGGMWILPSGIH
ncbi:uncharacterized protein [Aegilops tauschii subsp. strangulata]|uniref:uncharacterized protein n=1 Tax=Aegilops tauschii subsp. strangulata TaxID=200361 RepID=UPI003CC8DFE4